MPTKVRREFESLASAAERTGLSIRTLRRGTASGPLAAYRSGAQAIRVDPADVARMVVRMRTALNWCRLVQLSRGHPAPRTVGRFRLGLRLHSPDADAALRVALPRRSFATPDVEPSTRATLSRFRVIRDG